MNSVSQTTLCMYAYQESYYCERNVDGRKWKNIRGRASDRRERPVF